MQHPEDFLVLFGYNNRMKVRKKKRYQKEGEELVKKYARILNHHVSRVFVNFLNDIWKLNSKYFDEENEQ